MYIAAFGESDHLFDIPAHGFGFGFGGLDAFVL